MAPKIRLVLASHGKLSEGMLNTVQMLLGPQENIRAYCLMPETLSDLARIGIPLDISSVSWGEIGM